MVTGGEVTHGLLTHRGWPGYRHCWGLNLPATKTNTECPIRRQSPGWSASYLTTLEGAVFHSSYCGYGFAFPACNASATITICGFTECLIHHLGIPHITASDQRPQFTNEVQEWDHALEFTGFTMFSTELWPCYCLYLEIKYGLRRGVQVSSWQEVGL